jgi:hypothetical protein
MNRPQHTPGPWRIHRLANGWPVITSDAHDIADLRLNGNGLAHAEANAALIASAPELLARLRDVAHALRNGGMWKPKDWLFVIDAAIAKATTIENQPTKE